MRALLQPFILGIAGMWAALWSAPPAEHLSIWMALPAGIGMLTALGACYLYRSALLRRCLAVVLGVCLGGLVLVIHTGWRVDTSELTRQMGESRLRGVMRGTVTSGPQLHERGWIWDVNLHAIDGEVIDSEEKRVRLFVERDRHFASSHARPLPGDVIRVFARLERYPRARFPERPSPRHAMSRRHLVARGTIHDRIEVLETQYGPVLTLRRALTHLRLDYERAVTTHLSSDRAGIALAMTDGSRGWLDSDVWRAFQKTGTAHLLAISGLHMGVLASIVWWLVGSMVGGWPRLLRRWGRQRVCSLGVIGVLGLYVIAIGAPTSAVRAWGMVTAAGLAWALLRPLSGFHALAGAVLGMMGGTPHVVETFGFQLSVTATFAILCFLDRRPPGLAPPEDPTREESWSRRWGRHAGTAIGASLSATLATWPILIAWLGAWPLHAWWLNLVVSPLVSTLVFPVLCAGAFMTACIPSIGCYVLAGGAETMLQIGGILEIIADRPEAIVRTGTWPTGAVFTVMAGIVTWIASQLRPRPLVTGSVLVLVGTAIGTMAVERTHEGALRLDAIPVGQGDATLVTTPEGETILVDGGGSRLGRDPGEAIVVPYLTRLGLGHVDWIVATHADVDHVGGLPAVVDAIPPRHVVYDRTKARQGEDTWVAQALSKGAEAHPVSRRWTSTIGGAEVEVLRPRPEGVTSDNDGSLVVRLTYGESSILLPGDVERDAEQWLVDRKSLRADVLKVPHHGSKTSSTSRFLEAVDPAVAFVSAGRFNAFGHPHRSVIRRYHTRGIRVFQTARHGLVRVRATREGDVTVRTRRAEEP